MQSKSCDQRSRWTGRQSWSHQSTTKATNEEGHHEQEIARNPGEAATKGTDEATHINREPNASKDASPRWHLQAHERQDTPKSKCLWTPFLQKIFVFWLNTLPGVQYANVRVARTPKVPGQYRAINHLLGQSTEGLRLVRMPPEAHRRPCTTRRYHRRFCQCSV